MNKMKNKTNSYQQLVTDRDLHGREWGHRCHPKNETKQYEK